jgi:hypothetical protein
MFWGEETDVTLAKAPFGALGSLTGTAVAEPDATLALTSIEVLGLKSLSKSY